ncbi:MAG TPA: hypothetical protein VJ874_05870 [Candidatus Thermoplasmatota archaeon]|nr:hypothetical protein [Candidatus Thermoplasmatota archaeon]
MDPSELLPYFQLVGQVALLVGALVAVYQLVQLRRGRHQEAALQVITGLNTPEFRKAFTLVNELPIGAKAEVVRDTGHEMETAAATVMMTFETLGVLVHNRVVPIDLVDQVIGGFLRESWRRLEGYVAWKRGAIGYARWGEWYQWLFEHLAQNPRRAEGAYTAFKDWKP